MSAVSALILASTCQGGRGGGDSTPPVEDPWVLWSERTKDALETALATFGVPALGVVVLGDGELLALEVAGIRRVGQADPVAKGDPWHLGSCGKSMTATLVGTLVQDGVLRWESTVGELLAGSDYDPHPTASRITLRQLLDHRSGLPEDRTNGAYLDRLAARDQGPAQRRALMERVFASAPTEPPGSTSAYSNAGFQCVGALLEAHTGRPFEELLSERVLEALGMGPYGFGPPGRGAPGPSPWGHREVDGRPDPLDPRHISARSPPAYAPSGDVHACLRSWAAFARLHLGQHSPDPPLLDQRSPNPPLLVPTTLEAMHTPVEGATYSCGFSIAERPWSEGPILAHEGSSAGWHSLMWLAPREGFGILVVCNQGRARAQAACHAVATSLVDAR